MKSILICDDHALVREALSGTVSMAWPDARITTAGNFPSAWAAAKIGHDLCLADLVMPGAAPLAGIDGIIEAAPGMPVLVITGTEDDTLMLDLLDRGVAGFASKASSGDMIEAAIRLILAGGRYLPPRLAEIATSRIDNGAPLIRDSAIVIQERLSERQMEVLKLVASGRSNKEIARELKLAPSTVKTHVSQIMICLAAANRTEATLKARMLDLV
jgi:DNA-binding NarL/FixJ family response regulator